MYYTNDIYMKLSNCQIIFHLVIILREFKHFGNNILIQSTMLRIFGKGKTVHPCFLMQVQ